MSVRDLGPTPREKPVPTQAEIERLAMRMGSKVEDMDRAGDQVATFAPVTLGPDEIRTAHYVLSAYLELGV